MIKIIPYLIDLTQVKIRNHGIERVGLSSGIVCCRCAETRTILLG